MASLWTTAATFSPSAGAATVRCAVAGGSKHADRLLSSLQTTPSDDPSTADRLIRKFLAASSKSAALQALSRFVSVSSPFALPIYQRISEANWFDWKPKLAAGVIALLENQGRSAEAQALISDAVARLKTPRYLALFYCELIDSFSEHGLKQPVIEIYARLREVPYSGRRLHESAIKALCSIGMPAEAEEKLNKMAALGCKPSPFEFRSVVQSYGQLGLFSEMRRVLRSMEAAGLAIDTVCSNIVLSCYGQNGELSEMASWMAKMRALGIEFSTRTLNSALNSCPAIVSMATSGGRSLPLSIEDLLRKLQQEPPLLSSPSSSSTEALLVQEIIGSSILVDILEWSPSESKLDLHGFHLPAAYVILLKWMQELRQRFCDENVVPLEISVVCGSGKHSGERGRSPIKSLVSEMMFQADSPMRIDRRNNGRFIASGKAVREWLC